VGQLLELRLELSCVEVEEAGLVGADLVEVDVVDTRGLVPRRMPVPRDSLSAMSLTHVDRLVDHLTGGNSDAFAVELRDWVAGSRRFRAFAETHRDKIRKKVRGARGMEPRLDLRAELAVAHALLRDRRIDLAYEGYGATVGGPDFTVSFRSHVAFNLEVTRWRGGPAGLRRLLAGKLRQLPSGIANVVLIAVDVEGEPLPDLDALSRALSDSTTPGAQRDERQRVRRLSGMLAWDDPRRGAGGATLWTNPMARIALPEPAARAVLATLRD
jgi:hypothetical protein